MPARLVPTRLDKRAVRAFLDRFVVIPPQGKTNPDACWLWTNSKGTPERYPGRTIAGRRYRISVLMLWTHGVIPKPSTDPGLFCCHTCDNGAGGCVRPSHIFLGTQFDNMRDCADKGRNYYKRQRYCINGHDLNDPLVGRHYAGKESFRFCLTCKRDAERIKKNIPSVRWKGSVVRKLAITKRQLVDAVARAGGDRMRAGEFLGITKSSVYRKWHQFGLPVMSRDQWRGGRTPYRATITHCRMGHEFTPKNTYVAPGDKSRRRNCRVCMRRMRSERTVRERK